MNKIRMILLNKKTGLIIAILVFLFCISFYIFYQQVFYYRFYNIPKSDLSDHIKLITMIIQGKYHVPHSGFHYTTYLFSILTFLNFEYAAIILLSLFTITSYLVTYMILKKFLDEKYSERFLLIIAFFLQIITPVFLPLLNTTIYFGQGSPTIWHSPTFIMAKPFVLVVIMLTVSVLEISGDSISKLYLLLSSALLALSVFYKPNFALVLIPALGVFILMRYRNEFKKYVLSFLIILPSLFLLGYQFLSTYNITDNNITGTNDTIIFTFFGSWSMHSPCIPLSVIRGIIFPMLILIFRRRSAFMNNYLVLSWLIYLVAFLEMSFLAEKNSFLSFNFSWGYSFSLISLYIFSVTELLLWMKEKDFPFNFSDLKYSELPPEQKKIYISTIILYWGFLSGVIYLVRQILGYGFA